MIDNKQIKTFLLISGGIFALAIAMGVGRFAFTPILPAMQDTFYFDDSIAGLIASFNYAGYLIGAIACSKPVSNNMKISGFRYALFISILTTLLMGVFNNIFLWIILRFFAGVASAVVFIFGSSIVIDVLHRSKYSHQSILIYTGVGLGIAFSGFVIPLLIDASGVQNTWIALGLICLGFACWCWYVLPSSSENNPGQSYEKTKKDTGRSKLYFWLLGAYFCEGFGYIISGTFLVTFLQQTASADSSGYTAWIIVGIAAIVSIPLFNCLSNNWKPVYVLIFAHLIQAVGIILPVICSHWLSVTAGALLFGSTFMGITALTLVIGKTIYPDKTSSVIGLLTAVYGVGQILGPLVSGYISTKTGNLMSAISFSSAIVALGAFLLIIGIFQIKFIEKREKYHAIR